MYFEHPFGMQMPGRHGFATEMGDWHGSYAFSIPPYLFVDHRAGNTPLEYVASQTIELSNGFLTGAGSDNYVAYIADSANMATLDSAYQLVGNGYRYGFNGKENDKDISEGGQDYGMRIYDARIGKFLSIDPLTKKYPELTPYQFASNRPIDGIDLDGLEYATFNIYVDKNQKVTKITVTTDYELKKNGNEGPGVKYVVYRVDEGNRPDEVRWSKNIYGIYQGGDNPKLPKVGGNYEKLEDDYSLAPIDETDATARQHDKDYDKDNLSGIKGILDDRSTAANVKYIKKAKEIIKKYGKGEKDEVTRKPVTKEAKEAAEFGKKWFTRDEALKGKDDEGNVKKKEKNPYDARHKD